MATGWVWTNFLEKQDLTPPLNPALLFRLLLPKRLDFNFCTGHRTIMGQGFLSLKSAIATVDRVSGVLAECFSSTE